MQIIEVTASKEKQNLESKSEDSSENKSDPKIDQPQEEAEMTKKKRDKKNQAWEMKMQALNKQKDMSKSEDVQTENNVQDTVEALEGQLISKCSFGVFKSPKKLTNFLRISAQYL